MVTVQPVERLKRDSWGARRAALQQTRARAGLFYTLLAVVVYGLMPTIVRLIYDQSALTPLQLSFWRFGLSAPVLWIVALRAHPNHRPFSPQARASLSRTVGVGIFYGLSSVIAFTALQYIAAAVFIILFYTFPLIVVVAARLLGERLPRVFWLALVLTLSGVALTALAELGGGEQLNADARLGVWLALASAFTVALYFTVNQRILKGHGGVTRGVVWILTSAAVTLFVVTLLTGEGIGLAAIGDAWPLLILFGVFGTSFSVYTLNLGIQRLGAARTSVVATSEPIFALFFGWAIMGEWLEWVQLLGGALILASVILLTWRQLRAGAAAASVAA